MHKNNIKQQVKKQLAMVDSNEIKHIIRPLMDHFGALSLVYKSVKDDGSEAIVTTHPEWVDYYFEHDLFMQNVLEKEPSNYVKGELLWSQIPTHSKILSACAQGFNIGCGITLIRPFSDGCDFYYIGTDATKHRPNQLLVNNIDLIDKFIHYFKHQVRDIFERVDANRIHIPNKFDLNQWKVDDIPLYQTCSMRNKFLNELYKDGIHINFKGFNVHLTKREFSIAREMLQGKTMQKIAAANYISPRTVESHVGNIKQKFNVRKKSDLLMLLSKYI